MAALSFEYKMESSVADPRIRILLFYFDADADPDPKPAFHFDLMRSGSGSTFQTDANPDLIPLTFSRTLPCKTKMTFPLWCGSGSGSCFSLWCGSGSSFPLDADSDPDPASQNDANPCGFDSWNCRTGPGSSWIQIANNDRHYARGTNSVPFVLFSMPSYKYVFCIYVQINFR